VAVMSYRMWREKYGSDPSVIGAGYQINGHPFTAIGVAPPGLFGAKLAESGMPDLWLRLRRARLFLLWLVAEINGSSDNQRTAC
jgi:hypothetical protein